MSQERILFATLIPLARLAVALGVPLRRLKQLTELAVYEETRRKGMKMKEIQAAMSVGFSKVGTLSQEHKLFHASDAPDFDLQRRILLVLWALPLTEKHLCAAFPDVEPEHIASTLAGMLEEERLIEKPGRTPRYTVATNHNLFVQDGLFARISALRSLMNQVYHVIHARFFGKDTPAFARTLNFRVRTSDIPRLEQFYREQLFALVEELDEAVGPNTPSVPVKLSFLWSADPDREDLLEEEDEDDD